MMPWAASAAKNVVIIPFFEYLRAHAGKPEARQLVGWLGGGILKIP